jgi:hypothetical protein
MDISVIVDQAVDKPVGLLLVPRALGQGSRARRSPSPPPLFFPASGTRLPARRSGAVGRGRSRRPRLNALSKP